MSSPVLALHTTRGIEYDLLLRDLARTEPRYGFSAADIKLTPAQVAVIVLEFPDVVTEAVAGNEAGVAAAIAASMLAATGALIAHLVRERCASYILADLRDMCEQVEGEESQRERRA